MFSNTITTNIIVFKMLLNTLKNEKFKKPT